MEGDSNTTSVAVLPGPGMGHVTPFFVFARHLAAVHGIQVTFFLIPTGDSAAKRDLFRDPSLPARLRFVELPDVGASASVPPGGAPHRARISIIVRESLPSLRAAILGAAAPRPAVLVVDPFCTDAFGVADELGMSRYLYFTTNAWLLAHMMHLPALDRMVPGDYSEIREPLPVPGCRPVRAEDLMDPLLNRKSESYDWFLHLAGQFPLARGILVNSWEGLEPVSFAALREDPALVSIPTPPVYPVGPLTKPASGPRPEHECLDWLDGQPAQSVLFVSFGSRGTLSLEQTAELALGLELSRQRFLWVARLPALEGKGVGAEKVDPWEHLPEGFLERTRGRGMVVASWTPQVAVLNHPAVGAFLTHAGWNSTLESIVHSVPMVAWPLYAEQKMNATMLSEDLGVATRFRPDQGVAGVVGREEVERAVRMVMEGAEGKEMRDRVRELSRGARRAMEEGGSSYTALYEVATEWKNISKN